MNWTAVVPLKKSGQRKTRLAELLSDAARTTLSLRMFQHVLDVLDAVPAVVRTVVLADERPSDLRVEWMRDQGRGLNAELAEVRRCVAGDMIVLHADLPLLSVEDVNSLIDAAERAQMAIAPDRHGTGTNALALTAAIPFTYAFGINSFVLHRNQFSSGAVVLRSGLAFDLDTPDDFKSIKASDRHFHGFDITCHQ